MSLSDAKSILVVDDEPAARRLVCTVLRQGGYSVLEAGDCETAADLHRTNQGRIGLLLTDVSLADRSGCELAETLRRVEPDLPVLFMSGLSSPELECHGISRVGWRLLQKPFGITELLKRVQQFFEPAPAATGSLF